jgi:hypothetical protein
LVTSRGRDGARGRQRHYALVCHSDQPLPECAGESAQNIAWIDDSGLRNLRTGRRVGFSQVTSVVERAPTASDNVARYSVTFRAILRSPYLVALSEPTLPLHWHRTVPHTGAPNGLEVCKTAGVS